MNKNSIPQNQNRITVISIVFGMICYIFISYFCVHFKLSTFIFNLDTRQYLLAVSYIIAIGLLFNKIRVSEGVITYEGINSDLYKMQLLFLYFVMVDILTNSTTAAVMLDYCWCLTLFYISRNTNPTEIDYKVINAASLITATFVSIVYFANIRNVAYYFDTVNSVYYATLLFPFVLCISNRLIRIIGSGVIIAVTFFSAKGAGSLAIVAGLIIYFIVKNKVEKKNKKLLVLIAGVAVLYLLYIIFMNSFGGVNLFNEFEAFSSNSTSRQKIWETLFNSYGKLSMNSKIFGSGYGSATMAIGTSAHNDYFGVLYDYGLVGGALLILFYISLIKKAIYKVNTSSKHAPAFSCAVVIICVMSFFTHLIQLPTYFLAAAVFLGLYGKEEEDMLYD